MDRKNKFVCVFCGLGLGFKNISVLELRKEEGWGKEEKRKKDEEWNIVEEDLVKYSLSLCFEKNKKKFESIQIT